MQNVAEMYRRVSLFYLGRVALGIAPQGSHRSVLAQLRHTARQVRDSLRTVTATRSAEVKALAAETR